MGDASPLAQTLRQSYDEAMATEHTRRDFHRCARAALARVKEQALELAAERAEARTTRNPLPASVTPEPVAVDGPPPEASIRWVSHLRSLEERYRTEATFARMKGKGQVADRAKAHADDIRALIDKSRRGWTANVTAPTQ